MGHMRSGVRDVVRVVVGGCLGVVLSANLATGLAYADVDKADSVQWILVPDEYVEDLARGDVSVMDRFYEKDGVTPRGNGQVTPMMAVEGNPDGCALSVGHMHLRTSSGKTTVGYKPKITCDRVVPRVTLGNEIKKHMILGWWSTEYTSSETRTSIKTWELKSVEKSCTSPTKSKWRGTSNASMLATNGRSYHARTTTPDQDLKCGT